MTDFNKGDFTQQGVDGHVNAKIRLNAKRYLDIDLTSNEEASGCTIAGHVYDSLNEITYPIGSAPSGNIEITENTAEGEPLDVSQYATATVNVAGGSDLKTASITIVNPLSDPYTARVLTVDDGLGVDATVLPAEGSVTVSALIFKDGTLNVSDIYPATVSDNVNCTVTEILQSYKVSITDITQPASVTFTLSN